MKDLKQRIGQVNKEIAVAKKTKKKHKARAKIVRSYKGDATTHEVFVESTSRGIEASEAQRDVLVDELESEERSKKKRKSK